MKVSSNMRDFRNKAIYKHWPQIGEKWMDKTIGNIEKDIEGTLDLYKMGKRNNPTDVDDLIQEHISLKFRDGMFHKSNLKREPVIKK